MKKVEEYGEFFPFRCSPFGYNESKAQEYYPLVAKRPVLSNSFCVSKTPLTHKEAVAKNINWADYVQPTPTGEGLIPPDDIRTVDDSICEKIITCEESGKPFKIIKQELDFYKKKKLPIPHLHPQKRYEIRMSLRNPRHLWNRTCAKCSAPIQTTYAPDRPETVYCEKCYLEAIY